MIGSTTFLIDLILNNVRLIFIVFFIILFSACSNDKNLQNVIEYYSNGTIKASYSIQNKKINGLVSFNYLSGKKNLRSIFRNNLFNGYFIEYYENGNVKIFGQFSQGKKSGKWFFYNKNRLLSKKLKYLKIHGKYVGNQCITYDENGNIIKNKSRFLLFYMPKDTIIDGDEFIYGVRYEGMKFGKMMALFGDYDKEFYLHDSINVDTILGNGNEVVMTMKEYKHGLNILRGVVYDYKCEREKNGLLYKANAIYFEDQFFVKTKDNSKKLK